MSSERSHRRYSYERLLEIWSDAIHIRETVCHCRQRALMLSFQLPQYLDLNKDGSEKCGYWCALCGWSNAGARDVSTVEDED